MRDCTQLTQEEGYQIEAFLQAGHPQSGIATVLKRDKSTISREVSRSPVLLTLAERRTRYSIIAKAPDKSAQAVTDALLTVLQPHADLVHTLTYDNGKEFAYHQTVAKGLDAQGYFAHPYHSWESGLNENTNGLIRQYLPKGADFRTLTLEKVRSIMKQLNNRPRKCLDFKTPNQLFSGINPPVALTS
jgi:IS30 family transposase